MSTGVGLILCKSQAVPGVCANGDDAMQIRFLSNMKRAPIYYAAISFVASVLIATPASPQSSIAPSAAETVAPVPSVRLLDGQQFRAGIVRVDSDGKKRPLEDQLMFADGKFSSAVCKKYNFVTAPYWTRVEGDRVHFLAELKSPTDGTMVWKGSIRGNVLEGTMRWTKKRWYWTINTEHKIRGKLEKKQSTTMSPAN